VAPLQFEVDLEGKDRQETLMTFVRETIGFNKVQNLNLTELRMKVATRTLCLTLSNIFLKVTMLQGTDTLHVASNSGP
jgi:hypothetical protein